MTPDRPLRKTETMRDRSLHGETKARILVLSSWVCHGHVGLAASALALQMLGHSVTQVPSTVLSNHPGWPEWFSRPVPVDQIRGMLGALEANGWLAGHDACLIGYLPTAAHVALAADLVRRLRQGSKPPRIFVDPVLGDTPRGLYVSQEVAGAVRDDLVPLADVLTPNRFELEWLTGLGTETQASAIAAAKSLTRGGGTVLLTSAPGPERRIGVLQATPSGTQIWTTPRRNGVPHGVGDVFAGLVAAGLPVGQALGHLDAMIEASLGAPHLRIAEAAPHWTAAAPLAPVPLSATEET